MLSGATAYLQFFAFHVGCIASCRYWRLDCIFENNFTDYMRARQSEKNHRDNKVLEVRSHRLAWRNCERLRVGARWDLEAPLQATQGVHPSAPNWPSSTERSMFTSICSAAAELERGGPLIDVTEALSSALLLTTRLLAGRLMSLS